MDDDRQTQPEPDLALIRTELANERTILAYLRTALMLAGTGVSLVKFIGKGEELILLGWALIVAGALVIAVGTWRFQRLQVRLNAAGSKK